jgi:hypothetical protein
MNWLPIVLGLVLAQDGPIPPQRIDPTPMPVPATGDPVLPTDGRQAQEQPQRPAPQLEQTQRPTPTAARRAPIPASIFTDEEYRRARIRALLVRAMEGRV